MMLCLQQARLFLGLFINIFLCDFNQPSECRIANSSWILNGASVMFVVMVNVLVRDFNDGLFD